MIKIKNREAIKIDAVLEIKLYLAKKGLTQKYVCDKTGIGYDRLCRILKGKATMRLDEYEFICWALGVGVEKFLQPREPVYNRYEEEIYEKQRQNYPC